MRVIRVWRTRCSYPVFIKAGRKYGEKSREAVAQDMPTEREKVYIVAVLIYWESNRD
jgi:hypothetical protein